MLQRATAVPEALVATVAAPVVSKSPIAMSATTIVPFVLILARPSAWLAGWVALCAVTALVGVFGLVGYRRSPRSTTISAVAAAGVAQLLLCVGLVMVYGDDTLFLYSQHWEAALLVLFAGAGWLRGRTRTIAVAAIAVLVVCAVARSVFVWSAVFDALPGAS